MVRWLFLFFVCFGFGILFGNICNQEESLSFRWNTLFYPPIDQRLFFYYCMKERFPGMLLLLITGPCFLGVGLAHLSVAWRGFSFGTMLSLAVVRMGVRGLGIGICAMLPHYLIYIPVLIGAWKLIWTFHHYGGKKIVNYVLCCIGLLLLYSVGIFIEAYGNPYLLKILLT